MNPLYPDLQTTNTNWAAPMHAGSAAHRALTKRTAYLNTRAGVLNCQHILRSQSMLAHWAFTRHTACSCARSGVRECQQRSRS
eukprot:1157364-Pelagomonas_calceolata.AAC.12